MPTDDVIRVFSEFKKLLRIKDFSVYSDFHKLSTTPKISTLIFHVQHSTNTFLNFTKPELDFRSQSDLASQRILLAIILGWRQTCQMAQVTTNVFCDLGELVNCIILAVPGHGS